MNNYKIIIIGGKLQGVESVYLAKKAGFYTILIDCNNDVPARGICDEYVCADICQAEQSLIEMLQGANIILPALENEVTLFELRKLEEKYNLHIAFDFDAYSISSSKYLSDQLFKLNQIPLPSYFPDCKAPYIVKPSISSGSVGVQRLQTKEEVEGFLNAVPDEDVWIVQEYITGPSYSIEVIGEPGNYRTYQITEIHMDEVFDCNRVTSPCPINDNMMQGFSDIAVKLAGLVNLKGIMDVEVIEDKGKLKVLEIDARIPSQTPTAVYHSTGINLLSELIALFEESWDKRTKIQVERYVSYEHYLVDSKNIFTPGEHIMSEAGPLSLYYNYLGSDEVLTDYKHGDKTFRGTFINSADSLHELEEKRRMIIEALKAKFVS